MGKFYFKLTRPNFLIAVSFGLAMLLLTLIASPRQVSGAKPQQYAGPDTCAACHEDATKAFQGTIHAQEGFTQRSDKGCETCHGPGAEHAEAGGDKAKIKQIAALSAQEKSAICLQCHEEASQASYLTGMHARRNVDCTSCHSVHTSKSRAALLKASTQSDTCFICHKAYRSKVQRSSHHPIREGKMSCSSCHNPHDGTNPKMVTANSVNEKCYECHAEKRGPFLHEHAPVRENCANCHDPHGTNHDKLLQAKQPYLCQRCHFSGGHPGNMYDRSNTLAGSPLPVTGGTTISSRAVERECKNCHSQVHGSNSFSGPVFGR